MSTLSAPLNIGEALPSLSLISPTGASTTWAKVRPEGKALAYFMRTSSCPMCHQHLRQLESLGGDKGNATSKSVVIVPGDASDAASVERRHPALKGRVFASADAHAAVGLFVTMGMQQSGSIVVDADDVITYRKTAAVPMNTFSSSEVVSALA